ncbi:MAG: tRNA (adenosine(37)-N6)-dimethylallyltransferase MiaA [Actinobacteria bacterium]|nr:tRNA (adenosine(37)-N6)-dimethylallyltransferase MiaA [Actinomycetota bacterium]MCB9388148.1 tRNA (adenosine(37)-N6)-dimethylallyltransferase MiaA [Acidimicrobiia bacterium]
MTQPQFPIAAGIIGPTALGKSRLAMDLAGALGDTVILSTDSMQVYRRMDIGTAKPTAEERVRVPHWGIDEVEPSESWTVTRTQGVARSCLEAAAGASHRCLVVGGTGLYFHAVVDGFDVPPSAAAERQHFTRLASQPGGLAELYRRLADLDPVAASRIEPNNERRIVRALAVQQATGRPFSTFGPGVAHFAADPEQSSRGGSADGIPVVGLTASTETRARLIAQRIDEMIERGWLAEVEGLLSGTPPSATAWQAIGYREMAAVIGHEMSLDDAVVSINTKTRRFARRQIAWFRRDPRIRWFDIDDYTTSKSLLDAVMAHIDIGGAIASEDH